jgi:hypothetical protein
VGLDVSVGILQSLADDEIGLAYHRAGLARLSVALADEGVSWSEPDVVDLPADRYTGGSTPYSYLHYLRRAYMLTRRGEPVTPVRSNAEFDRDRRKVDAEFTNFTSHLLCHADDSGYYVPVESRFPFFLDAGHDVTGGGMVGSSQALLRELRACAGPIGLTLADDGSLPDAVAARIDGSDSHPFFREQLVWLSLHEACCLSIASGCAIVLH